MRLIPLYAITFPYFDKIKLIESNGTEAYDATRTAVLYERRRLVGFLSYKQFLSRRAYNRRLFRGLFQYGAYNVRPFMQ